MKAFKYLVSVLLIALLVTLVAVAALVHSSYATPAFNRYLAPIWGIQVEQFSYQYPSKIKLSGLTTIQNDQTAAVDSISLWIAPSSFLTGSIAFDSILIDGVNWKDDLSSFTSSLSHRSITRQFAIHNLDISLPNTVARGVSLQVFDPKWQEASQLIPFGKLQFKAEQLYHNGQAFDNVLIDANFQKENSTVSGFSFKWNGSDISGQAEQYPQGWSLINVTLNQFVWPENSTTNTFSQYLHTLPFDIYHINSLDILSGDLHWADWHLENLDLSLENWFVGKHFDQQVNAYLSMRADTVSKNALLFANMRNKLRFESDALIVEEFDTDFNQGRILFSAEFGQHHWHFDQLVASDIKLIDDTKAQLLQLTENIDTQILQRITIDQLDLERTQIIQSIEPPYWQLSGLNADGNNLHLSRFNQHAAAHWVLWDGQLEVTANSASFERFIANQAVLVTSAKSGNWNIDRFLAPLEQGYLDITANVQHQVPSAPWQLSAHGDGIPLSPLRAWLPSGFDLQGVTEMQLELTGLSGDQNMLAYSLSGQAELAIRDGEILFDAIPETPESFQSKVNLPQITLQAERGNIKLSPAFPTNASESITNRFDLVQWLVNKKDVQLEYRNQADCGVMTLDLLSRDVEVAEACVQ